MIFLFATRSCSTSWVCRFYLLDTRSCCLRQHRTRCSPHSGRTGVASKIHWRDQPSLAHVPAHAVPTDCHPKFLAAAHGGSAEDDLVAQDNRTGWQGVGATRGTSLVDLLPAVLRRARHDRLPIIAEPPAILAIDRRRLSVGMDTLTDRGSGGWRSRHPVRRQAVAPVPARWVRCASSHSWHRPHSRHR